MSGVKFFKTWEKIVLNFDQVGIFMVLMCIGIIAACSFYMLQFGYRKVHPMQPGSLQNSKQTDALPAVKYVQGFRVVAAMCTACGSFGLLATIFYASLDVTAALAVGMTIFMCALTVLFLKFEVTENTRSLCIFCCCFLVAAATSLAFARPPIGAAVIGLVIGYVNYAFDILLRRLLQI
jgi:hypothetical protein